MDTLKINILNPKAVKLLEDLADLNLITIEDSSNNNDFKNILERLRSKESVPLTLEEITAEVEAVRTERYAK